MIVGAAPRVAPPPPGGRPAHDPARPFWRFTPVASGHAGCPDGTCAAHNGVTLPDSAPWWREHTPPLHWGCLCRLETLTAREALPLITSAAALARVPPAQPGFGDGLQPGPLPVAPETSPPASDRTNTMHAPATRTLRGPPEAILFDAASAPAVGHRTWNQVARYGEFKGHPQGAFAFNSETFGEIVANFAATANGRVPVDYEHLSEMVPDNAAQHGVPAVAWIVALDDRGVGGLWACFEWVDAKAVEYVRDRRYLYVSPAVNFAASDRQSGEEIGARLTSVALTNHPFLDGMQPLTASTTTDPARFGLSPDSVHIPAGVDAPRKEPPVSDEMKKMEDTDEMKALRADAAAYRTLSATVCEMADMSAGTEADAMAAIKKKLASAKEREMSDAATMADRVIASGRVAKEGRDRLVALCMSDRASVEVMFPPVAEKAPEDKPATLTADAKTLLTERVAPDARPPAVVSESDDSDHLSESRAIDALATKLLTEKKAPNLSAAIALASREVRAARVHEALSRIPR